MSVTCNYSFGLFSESGYFRITSGYFADPDPVSGKKSDSDPDSGKKSDPDPDKRTRIRNTVYITKVAF